MLAAEIHVCARNAWVTMCGPHQLADPVLDPKGETSRGLDGDSKLETRHSFCYPCVWRLRIQSVMTTLRGGTGMPAA